MQGKNADTLERLEGMHKLLWNDSLNTCILKVYVIESKKNPHKIE